MKDKHVILLQARIKESSLTDARFAKEVMRVHPRTLRRWKGSYTPIPALARAFLENPQPLTWPTEKETPCTIRIATRYRQDIS